MGDKGAEKADHSFHRHFVCRILMDLKYMLCKGCFDLRRLPGESRGRHMVTSPCQCAVELRQALGLHPVPCGSKPERPQGEGSALRPAKDLSQSLWEETQCRFCMNCTKLCIPWWFIPYSVFRLGSLGKWELNSVVDLAPVISQRSFVKHH